ncbi:putative MAPEG superfamily protein [Caulobacter ginsengisoli]|uniref:MAPEG superfamily protein n=1 Tax=Caulobacter ginsengisoli TaxID=400775 RepID=A0ABU0IPR1_9CAUL|nr:MAPEG family protein [Caulobacter ginsengisoli]MDQ0463989.1 putative MAPEG superfamily protein [Caulobacter ginsengisoli]
MTFELYMLAGTLVLAFIQILLFDIARTGQYGLKWNTGARDEEMPPLNPVANRLQRAQNNLFETLPLFIGAVLIAHVAGCDGVLTHWGTLIYLAGRVVYVPLYAFGVKQLRSLVWLVSTAGLLMVFWAIFFN